MSANLSGSLEPGARLDTLSDFLNFYFPLKGDQEVILFLDRRPRPPVFLYPEASISPFAVAPSGVWLIDAYGHVHEFRQQNNPGPYVAEGYSTFPKLTEPTREQDLALPSPEQARARIAAALLSVQSMRPLLDKTATRQDVPRLMQLLRSRAAARVCAFGSGDSIADRLTRQLSFLNDRELLLEIFSLGSDPFAAVHFVQPEDAKRDRDFTETRVKYLLQTLSDRNKAIALRLAAVQILLSLSHFHSVQPTTKPEPIDNEWLAFAAGQIRGVAKTVFDDDSQDPRLRSLCFQLVPLDQAGVADVGRIYSGARSQELRFAIEEWLLEVGGAPYESVKAPDGPVVSIVGLAPADSCRKASPGSVAFFAQYYKRKEFFELYPAGEFVMTDLRTGRRLHPATNQLWSWDSMPDGAIEFELERTSEIPAGSWSLTLEYSHAGKTVGAAYPLTVDVVAGNGGNRIVPK